MSVEYDLVIVGGTRVAREAAIAAAVRKARVALVDPTLQPNSLDWSAPPPLVTQALVEIVNKAHRARRLSQTGLIRPITQGVSWPAAWDWARHTAEQVWRERSLTQLATSGVDVIAARGEFVRRPRLAFVAGDRLLRSRTFLLAPAWATQIPSIDGLATVSPWTPATLWAAPTAPPLPQTLVVLGEGAIALELAQTFNRLGSQVTLVTTGERLLPQADLEVSHLLQAQLEAEGVTILSHTPITQVRSLEGKKWMQVGPRALEADEILIANWSAPQLEGLNLEGAEVQHSATAIVVNSRLQTTNPRIYACGSSASRALSEAIAQAEVHTILRNALFLPLFSFREKAFPHFVATDPPFAQVGLTAAQASQQLGRDLQPVNIPLKQVGIAQIRNEITGFCKLVVDPRGYLLGAQVVGSQAREIAELLAVVMRSRQTITTLEQVSGGTSSFASVLQMAAIAWQQQELKRDRTWQDWLEGWFDFRRARAR